MQENNNVTTSKTLNKTLSKIILEKHEQIYRGLFLINKLKTINAILIFVLKVKIKKFKKNGANYRPVKK